MESPMSIWYNIPEVEFETAVGGLRMAEAITSLTDLQAEYEHTNDKRAAETLDGHVFDVMNEA